MRPGRRGRRARRRPIWRATTTTWTRNRRRRTTAARASVSDIALSRTRSQIDVTAAIGACEPSQHAAISSPGQSRGFLQRPITRYDSISTTRGHDISFCCGLLHRHAVQRQTSCNADDGRPKDTPDLRFVIARRAEPSAGNGAEFETYSWSQTLGDVSLTVPLPRGVKGRDCDVSIMKDKLRARHSLTVGCAADVDPCSHCSADCLHLLQLSRRSCSA